MNICFVQVIQFFRVFFCFIWFHLNNISLIVTVCRTLCRKPETNYGFRPVFKPISTCLDANRFINSSSDTNKIVKTPFVVFSKVAKLRQPYFLIVSPVFQQAVEQTFTKLLKNIMFWLWGNTYSLDFGWLMLFTWGHFTLIESRTVLSVWSSELKLFPNKYGSVSNLRIKGCKQILKQESDKSCMLLGL